MSHEVGHADVNSDPTQSRDPTDASDGASAEQFLSEMEKIRKAQKTENKKEKQKASSSDEDEDDGESDEEGKKRSNNNDTTSSGGGKYKQKLEAARKDGEEPYGGYKYKPPKERRSSLNDSSEPSDDVMEQIRIRREQDMQKAMRARKKNVEKRKAFGDQVKSVLAYLPFRTSHLTGFEN